MSDNEGMVVHPNETILREVTIEHLTESDKQVLLTVGFKQVQILIDSSDPKARHRAAVELAENYLKKSG